MATRINCVTVSQGSENFSTFRPTHQQLLAFQASYITMPKTALVTGATGLLGRSVLQAFQRADWQVFGTGLTRADQSLIRRVDLFDQAAVEAALDEVK